jgi:hypothetical protein
VRGGQRGRDRTTRLLKSLLGPSPAPLLSLLIPPLPPSTPASSIRIICRCGTLYFLFRSRICRRYDSVNAGRREHSWRTRPVRIVVRARGLGCWPGAAMPGGGSLGRSAITTWFSTLSWTISNSYAVGSAACPVGGCELLCGMPTFPLEAEAGADSAG